MSKLRKVVQHAELLAPNHSATAAADAGKIFQPFFGSQQEANEIRQHQTVVEQRKWAFYFEDWGCMVCGRKDIGHLGLGMCDTCHNRVRQRLRATLRRAQAERPTFEEPKDLERLAQEALAPSIDVLLRKGRGGRPSRAWRARLGG